MRNDELYTQGMKVNQFMVQIQELQDKENSWSDAKEFYDPDTASRSGFSHGPSQFVSIPSPRGLISRASCLQVATRNAFGTSGHVCEDLLQVNHRQQSLETREMWHQLLAELYVICKDIFNLISSLSSRRTLSAKLHG